MPTGQDISDALSGLGGAPVDRPHLDAFVANSQSQNSLRSAQTEDAMLRAQQMQDEQTAAGQLEDSFLQAGVRPAQAHLMTVASRMHAGSAINALDMFKAYNSTILGDPSKLGSADQTAASQAISGNLAKPEALANSFAMPAGVPAPTIQQTPQGVAQTALTNQQTKTSVALAGKDVADAEKAHLAAMQGANPAGSLTPQGLDMCASIVMADPTKMASCAGYGNAGQKNKDAINNAVAAKLSAANMSTDDMITHRAVAKASVGSAGAAAKQLQVLDAFSPLIKNNANRINQLLDQIDAAGSGGVDEPIVNGFERLLGRKLGSDDLNELNSVFTSYQFEISRLLGSGPSMNGVISDHARKDVEGMAPNTMTASNARRVLNRIDIEIGMRHQGVQNSLESAAHAQLPVISDAQPNNATAGAGTDDLPPGMRHMN
jgi:hypothetical protein